MNDSVVLTGCTGLIGRYVLRDLLVRNVPVAVVMRGSTSEGVWQRLDRIVTFWENELQRTLPRPRCIAGDLHRPQMGVNAQDRNWLARHARSIIHLAANVDFNGRSTDDEPWRTNVDGTRHVVELCRETDIEHMHYCSTAYVCGDRQGTIREEELDCGQTFFSQYERSKLTAELLLRDAGFSTLTTYRPSAVVGDSKTGFTSTFHGMYVYVQFIALAKVRAGVRNNEPWHHPIRLFCTGNEKHNFVPVDWVSEALTELVLDPKCHGRTYHLTSPRPVRVHEVEAAVAAYFNCRGIVFAGPKPDQRVNSTKIEDLLYAATDGVDRYWSSDPTFDMTNTLAALPNLPCPRIDRQCLLRLFDFAVRNRPPRRGTARVLSA
jgi:thioester reductase-like protein